MPLTQRPARQENDSDCEEVDTPPASEDLSAKRARLESLAAAKKPRFPTRGGAGGKSVATYDSGDLSRADETPQGRCLLAKYLEDDDRVIEAREADSVSYTSVRAFP
jgi:hypothetical protein